MKKVIYLVIGGAAGSLCGYVVGTVILGLLVILVSFSQDVANLLKPIEWLLDHPHVDLVFLTIVMLGFILGSALGYRQYLKKKGGIKKS